MKRTLLTLAALAAANTSYAHDEANCKDISNLLSRLTCYDESHDSTGSGPQANANSTAAQAQTPRSNTDASSTFGKPTELFKSRDNRTVSATLTKLDNNPRRKPRLVLDNGQVGELGKDRLVSYPEGAKVEIKTGTVGGYVMSVDGGAWFRVKRID